MSTIHRPFGKLRNSRGQIAIFIALVFQLLFVFFAMVINVGVLVHQKINLQNSVDLAAYYGAMKQAENLNAIAHVNYQIRQAWKLLVWRYQQLGSAGTDFHPYDYQTKTLRPAAADDSTPYPHFSASCTSYNPFSIYQTDNYCRKLPANYDISTSLPIPALSRSYGNPLLGGFDVAIANATAALGAEAIRGCNSVVGSNWFTLAREIVAYKSDLMNRKKTIYLIANGLSQKSGDFLDLDGESAREGALQTLKKNMSPENRDSASFKDQDFDFYNSMGDGSCGYVAETAPPKWLSEINIMPLYAFMDADCNTSGSNISFKIEYINAKRSGGGFGELNKLDPNTGSKLGPYTSSFLFLESMVGEPNGSSSSAARMFNSALGFEKNPWCMSYVGVKAKTKPALPFSPMGRVTLTAKAFAKPFGGKIGPWYSKFWTQGAMESQNTENLKIDPLAPSRVDPGATNPPFPLPRNDAEAKRDPNFNVNFSRAPGDKAGIRSNLVMARTGQAIHEHGMINVTWWDHVISEDLDKPSTSGDTLAWDSVNPHPWIRDLEVMAVSPDIFDLSYYSIEADYYRNYLARLLKRKDAKNMSLRGDLGSRRNENDFYTGFGIKDQIALSSYSKYLKAPNKVSAPDFPTSKDLTYYVLSFAHLLNSWQGKSQEDYSIDDSRFGKCTFGPDFKDGEIAQDKILLANPGNCIVGGRTGYSVKLVDEEYLTRSDLNLGGGSIKGKILNPPNGF